MNSGLLYPKKPTKQLFALLIICISVFLSISAHAETCEKVVNNLNHQLSPKIDEKELVDILKALNSSDNAALPDRFVTKKQAKAAGWRPGKDLWSVPELKGKSMGGDHFGNHEGRLPKGRWREADLDYKGGHRGGKRLIFSDEGKRHVTVDHYRSFIEVPQCR